MVVLAQDFRMTQTLLARLRDTSDRAASRDFATDELWEEHGWALRGRGVAVVILAVLIASVLMQLLG
jgi:hypothetical protein